MYFVVQYCIYVVQKHYICTTDFNITMATVKAFIRSGKKDTFANIRFRLSDGRNIQLFHTSELLVKPSMWDEKKEQYKAKAIIPVPVSYTHLTQPTNREA